VRMLPIYSMRLFDEAVENDLRVSLVMKAFFPLSMLDVDSSRGNAFEAQNFRRYLSTSSLTLKAVPFRISISFSPDDLMLGQIAPHLRYVLSHSKAKDLGNLITTRNTEFCFCIVIYNTCSFNLTEAPLVIHLKCCLGN